MEQKTPPPGEEFKSGHMDSFFVFSLKCLRDCGQQQDERARDRHCV